MSTSKFCPNCGQAVKQTDKFCQHCGAKLEQAQQGYSRTASKKLLDKKWLILGAVVLVLLGAYLGGRSYYQPNKQLERFTTALVGKGDVKSYLVSSDQNLKITAKDAEAFKKSFANSQDQVATMKQHFLMGSSYAGYSWVKSGSHWLIFPAYKLQVNPAYVTLTTNKRGVKFYQDGKAITKKQATMANGYGVKVGPLFPGQYTFTAKGKASGKPIVVKQTKVLAAGNNDLALELATVNFKVEGQAGQAVYINNEKVGTLDKEGEKVIKNYPASAKMKLYLTTKAGNKEIKSEVVDVSGYTYNYQDVDEDDLPEVAPKFKGLISKDEAEDLLESAFNEGEDGSSAASFVGEENNDSYNELVAFFKSLHNLSSYEVEDIKSISPESTTKVKVSYAMKYTFINYDSDSERKKIQQFTYHDAEIVYDQKDNTYKLQSVGKTGTKADWERTYSADEDD